MTATAEVIDGVARDVTDEEPQRGLQVIPEVRGHLVSGLGAIALMSDEDFERNMALLAKAKDRAQQLQRALLTEGTDYGTVPGIPRPFLHKPGAEIFEKAYGLATSYEVERKVGDGVKTPELEYIVHAKVHLGDTDGPVVGEGLGSCNTHESKYRYRAAKRSCPKCGVEGLIKGRPDGKLKGAYWCPQDKGGCNSRFPVGSDEYRAIEEQAVGQVENENPYDLANTILKMARKRAGVDGILTTTGTSGLFTQDDDSPAVRADSGGRPAASSPTDDRDDDRGQQQSGAKAPVLPKIPQGITEPTSLGEVTLAGTIVLTDGGATDGSLRQSEGGPFLAFKLAVAGGANVGQVVARGPLAEALVTVTDGKLAGLAVTVAGEMIARPWSKKNDETGELEAMPPARRTELARIETADWVLPAPDAPSAPVQAAQEAADAGGGPQEVMAAAMAAGPGMTLEAFKKACKAGKVAVAYADAAAKHHYQRKLDALTPQELLALAVEIEIVTDEEES